MYAREMDLWNDSDARKEILYMCVRHSTQRSPRHHSQAVHSREFVPYLEDVSAHVGGIRDLEGDLGASGLDASAGLDLVGLVAAVVASRSHDHHLLEVGDAYNERKNENRKGEM